MSPTPAEMAFMAGLVTLNLGVITFLFIATARLSFLRYRLSWQHEIRKWKGYRATALHLTIVMVAIDLLFLLGQPS